MSHNLQNTTEHKASPPREHSAYLHHTQYTELMLSSGMLPPTKPHTPGKALCFFIPLSQNYHLTEISPSGTQSFSPAGTQCLPPPYTIHRAYAIFRDASAHKAPHPRQSSVLFHPLFTELSPYRVITFRNTELVIEHRASFIIFIEHRASFIIFPGLKKLRRHIYNFTCIISL